MSWKNHAFSARYLLATNTLLSISLEGLSDCTQQAIEGNGYFDGKRTALMMIMGAFFGPIEHYWYGFLDQRLPGVSRTAVIKKVFFDEAVFGVSSVAVFFYGECPLIVYWLSQLPLGPSYYPRSNYYFLFVCE